MRQVQLLLFLLCIINAQAMESEVVQKVAEHHSKQCFNHSKMGATNNTTLVLYFPDKLQISNEIVAELSQWIQKFLTEQASRNTQQRILVTVQQKNRRDTIL